MQIRGKWQYFEQLCSNTLDTEGGWVILTQSENLLKLFLPNSHASYQKRKQNPENLNIRLTSPSSFPVPVDARTFRAGPRSRQRTVTYGIDDLRFLQLLSCFLTFLKLALEADVYTLQIKFLEEPVFVHKGPWHLLACLSLAF